MITQEFIKAMVAFTLVGESSFWTNRNNRERDSESEYQYFSYQYAFGKALVIITTIS